MCNLIIWLSLLSLATDVAHSTAPSLPEGIILHKGTVSWDEARDQCEREAAVFASPINDKALSAMKSVIGDYNITYHIGTKATELPGQFVSIEGIALEKMPPTVILDMVQRLDQWEGECLAMSRDSIHTVPCKSRLPYICYSTQVFNRNETKDAVNGTGTNCGPAVEGYKYDISTGNCYKLHKDPKEWNKAQGTCIAEGANLAVIENINQAQIIKRIDDFTHNSYIFIGLRRLVFKFGYISVHGQPVEELYDEWLGSVPRTGTNFQCGALHESGKWQNVNCDANLHFVCQRKPSI